MDNIMYNRIRSSGVIPVVAIDSAEMAVSLAEVLCESGVQTIEITFRTEAAEQAIANISKSDVDIIVGAGTVCDIATCEKAAAAGAKYIVTPGFNHEVVKWCLDNNMPVVPGVSTASEVETAMQYGLKILKFFPAEQSGGISMLKALSGPYGNISFIPTGGINENNLGDYLNLKQVVACGSSWICPKELINPNGLAEIKSRCSNAVRVVHDLFLLHIGVNCDSESEAEKTTNSFARLMGLPVRDGVTMFAGDAFEILKTPGRGEHGHIAISTRDIDRAVGYFTSMGYEFEPGSEVKDESGTIAIYFAEHIGGFAIHLRRQL